MTPNQKIAVGVVCGVVALVFLWALVESLALKLRAQRLERMAAAERARRRHEIGQAKVVNFPAAHSELPAGIEAPSSARKGQGS